jgi:anti-sigma factor RsiW
MNQFCPTDDMLEDFVNGLLDEDDCVALKVYLRQFPLLAASLERERQLMRGLKSVGEAIAAEPVPERLSRIVAEARAVRRA